MVPRCRIQNGGTKIIRTGRWENFSDKMMSGTKAYRQADQIKIYNNNLERSE